MCSKWSNDSCCEWIDALFRALWGGGKGCIRGETGGERELRGVLLLDDMTKIISQGQAASLEKHKEFQQYTFTLPFWSASKTVSL